MERGNYYYENDTWCRIIKRLSALTFRAFHSEDTRHGAKILGLGADDGEGSVNISIVRRNVTVRCG